MKALDTNVLVRLAVNDDPAQAARALAVVTHHETLLLPTVLLETIWVLGSTFAFGRDRLVAFLVAMLRIPTLHCWNDDEAAMAVEFFSAGLDAADALHLACTPQSTEIVTFDKAFAKHAAGLAGAARVELPAS